MTNIFQFTYYTDLNSQTEADRHFTIAVFLILSILSVARTINSHFCGNRNSPQCSQTHIEILCFC